MINNPKDIEKIKQELNNVTFEQLDKAIKETDKEWKDKQSMSEEEAIEDLKLFIKYANDSHNFREDYEQEQCKQCANSIQTILKALEKKDKEIESLNNQLDFITEQNKYIDKLEKIIKEKDKQIDLMSEEILKLDKEKSMFEYDHARIWDTENGIKQYFETKAKEE